MSNFQLIILGIFGLLLIFGVLLFACVIPGYCSGPEGQQGRVEWWGTVPETLISLQLNDFRDAHEDEFSLVYVEKDPRTLEAELLDALAAGRGPDLVSWPHDLLVKQQDKLQILPYESISRRQVQDTFIQEAQLLLTPSGTLGIPLYVDPLVMYYNTDLLAASRLAAPPRTWTALRDRISVLSQVDSQKNILQSGVALGGYANILNAKDILSMLMMQAGNPLVLRQSVDGTLQLVLREQLGLSKQPAVEALNFYSNFGNPTNSLYSWNSARPEAQAAFLRGELVMYLGFASELEGIRRKNPQLNFDVTTVPQLEGTSRQLTFGRLTSLVVPRQADNPNGAWYVAWALANGDFARELSEAVFLPPARIDLLEKGHGDPLMASFYDSAILSRGWLDPDPSRTGEIFKTMVEAVLSGRLPTAQAVSQAHDQMAVLMKTD